MYSTTRGCNPVRDPLFQRGSLNLRRSKTWRRPAFRMAGPDLRLLLIEADVSPAPESESQDHVEDSVWPQCIQPRGVVAKERRKFKVIAGR